MTVGGRKMSKTLGNVVDPFELVKKSGADAVRYYLLRQSPSTDDGDFSIAKFEERYSADLANGLGNFAARLAALALRTGNTAAVIPERAVTDAVTKARDAVRAKMAEYRLHEAVAAVWDLIAFGNRYVNDRKPWDKSVSDEDRAVAIGNGLAILDAVSDLLVPFLPNAAEAIRAGDAGMLFPRVA
jgi:methionyl-tRNA synthetase